MLALGGVGTVGARQGQRQGASGDDTIVDVAVANGFDVLAAAVGEAGLVDFLSGRRQLTVFAPTDAAFNAIGATVDNVDDIDFETVFGLSLAEILSYHVTPGRRYAASVVRAPRVRTLLGPDIAVDGTVLNGGQADIVLPDVEASNGVVHAINGVLLPP